MIGILTYLVRLLLSSKTLVFNTLQFVAWTCVALSESGLSFITSNPELVATLMAIGAFINNVLRLVTTKSVLSKVK